MEGQIRISFLFFERWCICVIFLYIMESLDGTQAVWQCVKIKWSVMPHLPLRNTYEFASAVRAALSIM